MKNLKRIMGIVLTISMVASMWSVAFAGSSGIASGGTIDTTAKAIINLVLRIIGWVGYGVALGMAVYIGIKYMMSGAGEKAKVKETLLPYLIGALLVGSAATIVNALIGSSVSVQVA